MMDALSGLGALGPSRGPVVAFEKAFAEYLGVKYCLAVNKGTTGLYLGIQAMKTLRRKTEVLLPAYTVPTLTLAMNKAGLKTRLCDISLETFNMDPVSAGQCASKDTLCIVPVHMFGFPCEMDEIKKICGDLGAFMLEDPAQAMGAELHGRKVGTYGDTALFSLCKGKVISTFQGGLAVTDNDELASLMARERGKLPPAQDSLLTPGVLLAFSLAMRPLIYGALFPLISRFKSTEVHEHFDPFQFTGYKAAVALRLLPKMDEIIAARTRIGMAMYRELKDLSGLRLPAIIPGAKPAFNHFPVLFDDLKKLEKIEKTLWEKGIDTARFYKLPIHRIYDLGYRLNPDPFPNATYLAERLLVFPSHPYMTDSDVAKIIDVCKKA
jgi:dTDP-4-amino-4,6-dideoxygalactose transaminase